jgi:hypothetical protein
MAPLQGAVGTGIAVVAASPARTNLRPSTAGRASQTIQEAGTVGTPARLRPSIRRDVFEVEPQNWLNVPDETLGPSNLFGLVTLLCVPDCCSWLRG